MRIVDAFHNPLQIGETVAFAYGLSPLRKGMVTGYDQKKSLLTIVEEILPGEVKTFLVSPCMVTKLSTSA